MRACVTDQVRQRHILPTVHGNFAEFSTWVHVWTLHYVTLELFRVA